MGPPSNQPKRDFRVERNHEDTLIKNFIVHVMYKVVTPS